MKPLCFFYLLSFVLFNFPPVECIPSETAFSPVPQPAPAPETSENHISFPPSASAPIPIDLNHVSASPPSQADSHVEEPSVSLAKPLLDDIETNVADLHPTQTMDDSSANVDQNIKKICEATDYPSLCVATVAPLLGRDSTDVMSVLEVAIKASKEVGKLGLAIAKRIANTPGMPENIVKIIKDCADSYDDVLYNFQNAMDAWNTRDVGTMKTMLSAVLTDIGDCEDDFSGIQFPSSLSTYGDKLANMTSNCLAIIDLIH